MLVVRSLFVLFIAHLAVTSLPAQRTWNVSAQNLPAAVQAAAPGDVLLVSGSGTFFVAITIQKRSRSTACRAPS